MSDLSIAETEALLRVAQKEELQAHFFSKIKKLKWFDPIQENGLLNPNLNPRPINTSGEYYTVPSWPVTEYLVATSPLLKEEENRPYADKYLQIVRDVTRHSVDEGFSNHRTWWQFSKILRNIPPELITDEDLDLIHFWLNDKIDRSLIANELGKWLSELIDNYNLSCRHVIIFLLQALFHIDSVKSRFSEDKNEAEFKFDEYYAEKIVDEDKVAFLVGDVVGLDAVNYFQTQLESSLDIHENDRWSAIWRKAIEEHDQNSPSLDAQKILLKAFRESMLGFTKTSPEQALPKIKEMLDSEYQIIKRIGVFIVDNSFDILDEDIQTNVLDESFFKDPFRHEIWLLLKNHFHKYNESIQNQVLAVINAMQAVNQTGEILAPATSYKKLLWLSAIKNTNDMINQLYAQEVAISGAEPDHPDFSSYSTSGPLIFESPIEIIELTEMLQEPQALVDFLNSYDHVGHFNEPGLEGLVNSFGGLISQNIEGLEEYYPYFIQLKPYYLHEIFNSISEAWNSKQELNWDNVWVHTLSFSINLLDQDGFWASTEDAPSGAFIGNRNWVVGTLCRLIEAGCKVNAHSFSIDTAPQAKLVLEKILEKQEGEEFSEESDAVSVAINSPRGRCLEAYINLALFECRGTPEDQAARDTIWLNYQTLFNNELTRANDGEYEFATLVANFLPNFRYLSKDWVSQHLSTIFDQNNSLRWLCAVQGYSYVGQFDREIYEYLKNSNDFIRILENDDLRDKVEDRYIQFMVLGYFHAVESLSDDDSLINKLLVRNKPDELSQLVWFIWTLRDSNNPRSKEIVYELFPKILQCLELQTENGRKLASRLCSWCDYFDEFDEKSLEWMASIASYAEEDFNSSNIMKALVRLSNTDVMKAHEIWVLVLQSHTYDYPDAPIKSLFSKLVESGPDGVRAAKEIASLYHKHGTSRPIDWLNEIIG